jgi:plastocyanin
MKHLRSLVVIAVLAVTLVVPMVVWADVREDNECTNVVQDAFVNFGVPGEAGAANHFLVPDEVTINKGGTVTWTTQGGGHGIAIYPVPSKTTVRGDITEDLCNPRSSCDAATVAAFSSHVTDAAGNLIIDTDPVAYPPANRISYPENRLLWAGAGAFLANLTQVQYRFPEDGLYLVTCINRGHFINDWMFGFVNVINADKCQ